MAAKILVFFVLIIAFIGQGLAAPAAEAHSFHIEGMPRVDTNLSPGKVLDVFSGKRKFEVSAGADGISINAGYTDEEKLMIAGAVGLGIILLLGCACCCAKCCCCGGRQSGSTTNIIYQPFENPPNNAYNPTRSAPYPAGWNGPVAQQKL